MPVFQLKFCKGFMMQQDNELSLNIKVNPQWNDSRKRKSIFWIGPVRAQTLTPQRCCGMTLWCFHTRNPTEDFCKEQKSIIHLVHWVVWYRDTKIPLLEITVSKGSLSSYQLQGFTCFFSLELWMFDGFVQYRHRKCFMFACHFEHIFLCIILT